eukprot:10916028-Alexandrium_andersonii.AAC.1
MLIWLLFDPLGHEPRGGSRCHTAFGADNDAERALQELGVLHQSLFCNGRDHHRHQHRAIVA